MKPSEYFHNKAETYLKHLPDRALNAGINVATTIIVTTIPYTAEDYQHAFEAWLQGRHDIWQNLKDAYKANPTNKNLTTIAEYAIHEHTPHTQCDYDNIVEHAYRLAINETLIENELKKRRNNSGR